MLARCSRIDILEVDGAKQEARLHQRDIHPVAAVNTDHQTTIVVKSQRGPFQSLIQPPEKA